MAMPSDPFHDLPPEALRDRADQEAFELMIRLTDRVLVARSFARLAAGMVKDQAARASEVLRACADVAMVQVAPLERAAKIRRVARAAAEAAVQVAGSRARPVRPPRSPSAPAPSLDHEALHDDAC